MRIACAVASLVVLLALACEGGRKDPSGVRPITGGDATRGEHAIHAHGCGACHTIPGIRGAHGTVGPSLDAFAKRTFIAGELPNTPENLVRWILDPRAVHPKTGMPVLYLERQEARDVAAYLYTLD